MYKIPILVMGPAHVTTFRFGSLPFINYYVQTQVEKKGCLTIQSADTTFATNFFS